MESTDFTEESLQYMVCLIINFSFFIWFFINSRLVLVTIIAQKHYQMQCLKTKTIHKNAIMGYTLSNFPEHHLHIPEAEMNIVTYTE